ncbi:hypothetical protein MTR67_048072 [Solanum verrucosum]|uniref:Integrase zinc-binding domain-containing protein n=1 Tax=Solanum verrucosum TaxID=315347 RepID=A0AAF0UY78_SOLVR|nr:hypothetical protein MTR67_048072 [Solanum verrucosum]
MRSVAHVEEDKKELVRDVLGFARLKTKENKGLDTILIELKEVVLKKLVKAFSQGGDRVLRYQGHLCGPNVDELREQISSETHFSRYSIHMGASNMYRDLRKVYWWNMMKKYIVNLLLSILILNK